MMDNETGEWATKNITTTFFKCTKWQVEETTDLLNCPFHYFCDSSYAGNYPPLVDMLVLAATVTSFLSSAAFTVLEFKSRVSRNFIKRRHFLPSGPVMLPMMMFVLANGRKINTFFPLSQMGPSILLLIHVSALGFVNTPEQRSMRYALLEASTISGILHASLNLDSIILPYYTGLDALSKSFFSDECPSCVCRKEDLVVGGRLVSYRGCSKTTLLIVTALFSRMLCSVSPEKRFSLLMKLTLEGFGWVAVAGDAVYLTVSMPYGSSVMKVPMYGGICTLIFLNVFRRMYDLYCWHKTEKMKNLCLNDFEIL
ncbi:hypothetical protein KSP40_PGU021529 [Platanthera guangdongensis]|uniref:Uncharacterized protein n=1 Tax=Platanthera guangdongensis TaxID=2320717 RepID=A0ABR2LNL7_9ASPA